MNVSLLQATDEGHSMAVPVKGMIIVWKARATMSRQAKQETSISTQFVEDDIEQYIELASMFANLDGKIQNWAYKPEDACLARFEALAGSGC